MIGTYRYRFPDASGLPVAGMNRPDREGRAWALPGFDGCPDCGLICRVIAFASSVDGAHSQGETDATLIWISEVVDDHPHSSGGRSRPGFLRDCAERDRERISSCTDLQKSPSSQNADIARIDQLDEPLFLE
ncbi:hypothetical protein, partial [Aurantimonas sp. C2-4-R8]|nr:hypothetical protein [Aurantimonas sp. C2-4-R8]